MVNETNEWFGPTKFSSHKSMACNINLCFIKFILNKLNAHTYSFAIEFLWYERKVRKFYYVVHRNVLREHRPTSGKTKNS